MLHGKTVTLRAVKDEDVDNLWERHTDLDDRGPHFPLGFVSLPRFRRDYEEHGFWTEDHGMLLMVREDVTVGHIEHFRTVKYLDEIELSYQVYGADSRGKGVATEAVRLMTRYLFQRKPVNRIRLVIHPDNAASRRVAEKAGFTYEGIARGAWYNRGLHHDVAIYAALREEFLETAGDAERT